MSDGSEFQVCGAATENARRANSDRVLAADSSGASEDRSDRTGTAGWIRSCKYEAATYAHSFNLTHRKWLVCLRKCKQSATVEHMACSVACRRLQNAMQLVFHWPWMKSTYASSFNLRTINRKFYMNL